MKELTKPLVILLFFLAACSPDPVEQAIINYEENTETGRLLLDVDVMSYQEVGKVTAQDSARVIREVLEGKAQSALVLFGPKSGQTFEDEFKGASVLHAYYLKMKDYESRPGDVLATIYRASIEKDVPGTGNRAQITRKYGIYKQGVVFIVE